MQWFTDFWQWLLNIFQAFIDFPYDVFDSILTFVEGVILSINIDFSGISNVWVGVPPQLLYILQRIHFTDTLLFFFSIVLIRFIVNLIPSWATRA